MKIRTKKFFRKCSKLVPVQGEESENPIWRTVQVVAVALVEEGNSVKVNKSSSSSWRLQVVGIKWSVEFVHYEIRSCDNCRSHTPAIVTVTPSEGYRSSTDPNSTFSSYTTSSPYREVIGVRRGMHLAELVSEEGCIWHNWCQKRDAFCIIGVRRGMHLA
jgi:hypothetical protein